MIKFTQQWQLYNGGDVATFPAHIEESLCTGGVAVPVNLSSPSRAEAKREALAVKTNKELGEILKARGESPRGNKSELIARLLGEGE